VRAVGLTTTSPRTASKYGGLGLGVAGVSVAAILIRLADTEPLTVAAYRMGIASVVVSGIALVRARSQFQTITRSDLLWLLLSGGFLAAHFAAFITALSLTSVANTVLITTSAPLFVAIGSHWGLRDRVSTTMLLAILLSVGGGIILTTGDLRDDNIDVTGNLLAVVAAIAVTGYYLIGRNVRARVPLMPYISVVYAASAVLLLSGAVTAGSPLTGLSGSAYFWMAMVALISQVIGHSGLNWALAHLTATTVSLGVRAEPIIATLLAIVVLDEIPSWTVGPGGGMVLAGVYLAIRSETVKPYPSQSSAV
jgi:drug/metabolite transporter (DMT)-like permease